jgi:hypothetical protein
LLEKKKREKPRDEMADHGSKLEVGEANKLTGTPNYYVWSLKMRAILCREGIWDITENAFNLDAYPVVIDGVPRTEVQVRKMKDTVVSGLILLVHNDIIDVVVAHRCLATVWLALTNAFQSGDQSQILGLMSQLQSIKLMEGGSVEDYVKKSRELKNRLASMGKTVTNRNLTQLILNRLPRSFESTIQTLTHQTVPLTFEQIVSSLTIEGHRCENHSIQLGDEQALVSSFQQRASLL